MPEKWIATYTIGGSELNSEVQGTFKDEKAVGDHIEKVIPNSKFVKAIDAAAAVPKAK